MRFRQLALRVDDAENQIRFHDRLTVVAGLREADRRELIEVLLGTLAGEPTRPGDLTWSDASGRETTTTQDSSGLFGSHHRDGQAATAPLDLLAATVQELFELAYVGPNHLGLGRATMSEPQELAEARATLAALKDELHTATVARDAVRALQVELSDIQSRLRDVDSGRARRRYARVVLQLEQARLERNALSSTPQEIDVDERWAGIARDIRPIVERWRSVKANADTARARFGNRPRLDQHTLAGALAVPDKVPPRLDALAAALRRAESEHLELSARLASHVAEHVERPSHPDVARLARVDQTLVWQAARHALETSLVLERESLRVGGVLPDGSRAPIATELDDAHTAVEAAQEAIEKRRFGAIAAVGSAAVGALAVPLAPVVAPLALAGAASAAYWAVLSPRQQLVQAQLWEEDTLSRIGVPSYLAFHLRRMDAAQDPELHAPLEQAANAYREAMGHWRRLAGDLPPASALALEPEVRSYAARLSAVDDLGTEAEAIRRRLMDHVEPAVNQARERFLEVIRPFGIENPVLASDLVRQIVDVAKVARRQLEVEAIEAELAEAAEALDERFTALGMRGDIEDRIASFEAAAMNAEQRIRARAMRRPIADVDAEIHRLQDMARAEYRPEYGSVTAQDAAEPDPEELRRRRELTATALTTASRLIPDIDLIADRKQALERRVEFLEEHHSEVVGSLTRASEVEPYLAERITEACAGDSREPLPLLIDDLFANVRADQKWDLLDMLDHLSAGAQIVYLTNDPDALRWARRRAQGGSIAVAECASRPLVS